jgi:hypothetical protein
MTQEFYCEFKTWAQGPVSVEWPFFIVQETDDYRHSKQLDRPIPRNRLTGVFMSFDTKTYQGFLADHVPAAVVGILLSADSIDMAYAQLEDLFGHIEMLGYCQVDESNRGFILSKINGADG